MNRPHLMRMLMVNSGKKALVDLDFTESLHLHGRNNAGKTTFVNALQFCFTDRYSSMVWDDHSTDETRRHYFPESSYICFTVWTEFGLQNLLLVGYGAARGFRFQRWVFPGDLDEKLLYSDQDGNITPRSTIDVERDLHLISGSRKLTETEMKGWIDGSGDSPFGLVPLKRSGKFSDFRKLFNNLLRLNKLDSNEIKSLIINCTSAIPNGNESINLRAEFREAYLDYKSQRHKIELIERNRGLLEQFLSDYSSLANHRSRYAGLFLDVQPKIAPYLEKLESEIAALDQELGARQQTRTKMLEQKGEFQREANKLVGTQALLTEKLEDVKSRIREAEGASQLELTSELARINTEERSLQAAISTGEYESIDVLKLREKETRQSIKRLEELIAGGTNLGIDILTLLGPEGSENILKLLSDKVRSLPPATYTFGGDGSFAEMVQASDASHLTIGDLTINLDSVPPINVIQTMEDLETARDKKQAEYERIRAAIHTVEKRDEAQRTLESLRGKRAELTRVLDLIHSLPESKQSLEVLESNHKETSERLDVIQREVDEIDEKLIQFEKHSTDIREKLNQKRESKSRIEQRFDALPLPNADWSKSVQNEFRENLGQAIEHLFERFDALQTSEIAVDRSRLLLHNATEGIYQAEDLATEVDSVAQELDSLKSMKELLAKNEGATQTIMQERISTFLTSLDSVRRMVQLISKELRDVRISNIDSFSLRWVERRTQIGKAMKSLRKQTKIFDFESSDRVEDLVSYLFEQERLHLSDFFDLSLNVKIDERVREYDKIERIESKGTSLGILICIHVVLLKHMTQDSRGRLPIFIDEVEKLDSNNIRSIVNFCEANGFLVITASPRPNTLPRIQYWLDRSPFTNSSHRQDWGVHDGEE